MTSHHIRLTIPAQETTDQATARKTFMKALCEHGCTVQESEGVMEIVVTGQTESYLARIQQLFLDRGYPVQLHRSGNAIQRPYEKKLFDDTVVGARPVEGDRHHEHHVSEQPSSEILY